MERVIQGEFLSLSLEVQDSPESPENITATWLLATLLMLIHPSLRSARVLTLRNVFVKTVCPLTASLSPGACWSCPHLLLLLFFSPVSQTVSFAGLRMTNPGVSNAGLADSEQFISPQQTQESRTRAVWLRYFAMSKNF